MRQNFRFLMCYLAAFPLATLAGTMPPPPPPPPPPLSSVPGLPMLSNGAPIDDLGILSEACQSTPLSQSLEYPAGAGGASGTATLRVVVNPCGQIRRAYVQVSSGSGVLDQSALVQASHWVIALPRDTKPGHGLVANLPVRFEYTGSAQSEALANYDLKLGQMHGLIASAKMQEQICAEAFPDRSTANHAAHMAWRQRHLATIETIENRFQARLMNLAGDDPVQLGVVMRRFADKDAQYQIGLRQQMMADGQRNFEARCIRLPDLLNSDDMDLDKSFSEQMQVIQAGMPAQSAAVPASKK